MEIHITREQANNESFLNANRLLAEALGCELMIDYPVEKPKRYDCSIWVDENYEASWCGFDTKKEALAWAKAQLGVFEGAVADLKKWDSKGEDFEDWQYRIVDGEFREVDGFGW